MSAALIAFLTTIVTLSLSYLLKFLWERHFHVFKLEAEYKYEQRKKIKDILSKNKMQLLNCCESLNHRLWNFSDNHSKYWHKVNGDYCDSRAYYFNSFVYRLMAVFAWIRKIEEEMIYLDTTIASKEDMEFIKFLRVFPEIMYDIDLLFKGYDYDANYQTDHFFRNNLETMAGALFQGDSVCTFAQFENRLASYSEHLRPVCQYVDGISPTENRLRWDRLQVLHVATMVFLNSYGYDFQRTTADKLRTIIKKPRRSKLLANFADLLERNSLASQKEFKRTIRVLLQT